MQPVSSRPMQPLPLTEQFLAFARASGIVPPSVVEPVSQPVEGAGVSLRYIDWGGEAPHPVVWLHGGGLTAHTWDLVCLALRDRYHCFALDLRGHGESGWPADGDYSLHRYSDDVGAMIDALGLMRPVLVGNSLGGQAAMLCAAERDDVDGLVLVDVGPEPDIRGSRRIIRALSEPQEFSDLESAVQRALKLNPRRDPDALRSSVRHNLRRLDNGSWTWKYDSRAFGSLSTDVMDERTGDLWRSVDQVTCPVLIARGADSDVFTQEQADVLAARLARAEVRTVADAGHTVQGDNPRGLVAALEPFLAGL